MSYSKRDEFSDQDGMDDRVEGFSILVDENRSNRRVQTESQIPFNISRSACVVGRPLRAPNCWSSDPAMLVEDGSPELVSTTLVRDRP